MPRIANTPGLTWRETKHGWEARWRARADLVRRGFRPAVVRLWASEPGSIEPTEFETAYIQDRCASLQGEMLVWGRGGLPDEQFDGTVASLVRAYQTDEDSSYKNIRYNTRQFYDSLCGMVVRDLGEKRITEITARDLLRWHRLYADRVAMGHSLVGMLRTLSTFGSTILGVKDCRELKLMLSDMRFKAPKPRTERLTAQQVIAIRKHAPKSIALAQALSSSLPCARRM